eukprot:UN25798
MQPRSSNSTGVKILPSETSYVDGTLLEISRSKLKRRATSGDIINPTKRVKFHVVDKYIFEQRIGKGACGIPAEGLALFMGKEIFKELNIKIITHKTEDQKDRYVDPEDREKLAINKLTPYQKRKEKKELQILNEGMTAGCGCIPPKDMYVDEMKDLLRAYDLT